MNRGIAPRHDSEHVGTSTPPFILYSHCLPSLSLSPPPFTPLSPPLFTPHSQPSLHSSLSPPPFTLTLTPSLLFHSPPPFTLHSHPLPSLLTLTSSLHSSLLPSFTPHSHPSLNSSLSPSPLPSLLDTLPFLCRRSAWKQRNSSLHVLQQISQRGQR